MSAIRAPHAARGQVLVEFAFASFFVLTMLFGIIEFGRALYAYDLVTSAARMGSRYAMVNASTTTQTTLQTYLRAKLNGIDTTQLAVVLRYSNSATCLTGNGNQCTVLVTVTYPFKFVWRFATINMTSQSQMVIFQ